MSKRDEKSESEIVARQLADLFPKMMMQMVRLGDGLPRLAAALTPQQLRVLSTLDLAGKRLRMSELSRQLRVSQSTVTDASKRLLKMGYLVRERSVEDDRVVWLSLSEAGRSVVRDLKQGRYKLFQKVCEKLTAQQRSKFLQSHQFIFEVYSDLRLEEKKPIHPHSN
jgi:DNA-binding MarR family transcriptional regulator